MAKLRATLTHANLFFLLMLIACASPPKGAPTPFASTSASLVPVTSTPRVESATLPRATVSATATSIAETTIFAEETLPPLRATLVPEPTGLPTITPIQNSAAATPAHRSVHLPILMYHHLEYLRPNADLTLRSFTVAPDIFEQQVAYLYNHNYHTIYFSDLIAYFRAGQPLPSHPVILTFDDAWRDDYFVAFPILKKYGMVGTFFVPSGYIDNYSFSLTWEMIKEMSDAGMEFGGHTITHPILTRDNAAQIWREVSVSKAALEEHLGKPLVAFAYPFGVYNQVVIDSLAQAGYDAAVTVNYGLEQNAADIYLLRRVNLPYWESLGAFIARLEK